jgi:hypothetical protein
LVPGKSEIEMLGVAVTQTGYVREVGFLHEIISE